MLMTETADHAAVQRRTLRVLVLTQLLGGVGLAAGAAVGSLLARDMLGGNALAGVPSAVGVAGGALAAVPISRLMGRFGRRPGLMTGYLTGAAGAGVVLVSAELGSFALLMLGMLLFGAGNTSSLLARYAAADLAAPDRRGSAVSIILFATTFGAVTGPNLIEPTGAVARAVGLPTLAGPFLLSAVAYVVAAVTVTALLRPDPLLVARAAAPPAPLVTGSAWSLVLRGPALAGLTAMVGAQLVMVAMMTMTPVHMLSHGHDLGVIGFVISAHLAGMFFFAPVGGVLCDRYGSTTTVQLGAVTLIAAGVSGALAPASSAPWLTLSLFLLGLGWSLSLVGGSTLLTQAVPLERRAAAQGNADLAVGMAGASGGLGSGLVLAASGFVAIALLTAAVSVALLATSRVRAG
jgi:MFS family permease